MSALKPSDEAAFRHGYRDGFYDLDDWTENPNANPACFSAYRTGRAAGVADSSTTPR